VVLAYILRKRVDSVDELVEAGSRCGRVWGRGRIILETDGAGGWEGLVLGGWVWGGSMSLYINTLGTTIPIAAQQSAVTSSIPITKIPSSSKAAQGYEAIQVCYILAFECEPWSLPTPVFKLRTFVSIVTDPQTGLV
jgi:hypothetical protein